MLSGVLILLNVTQHEHTFPAGHFEVIASAKGNTNSGSENESDYDTADELTDTADDITDATADTDSNSSGSFSDDEDTPPPNFQPWMKDQNLKTSSNRNSNKASNLIVAKKKKSSGWGALKSLFRNKKKKKK